MKYYRENAQEFIERTENTVFNNMQTRFLQYLRPGDRILDFGCGSGRDAAAFMKLGYKAEALDATEAFIRKTRNMGIPSRCMLYSQFVDQNLYDGIWACASLLHLSDDELTDALSRIHAALKPCGVFYCSMKRGSFQGERDGRWFHDQTMDSLKVLLERNGFEILELFESEDSRPEQKGRPWVNGISRKIQ